MTYILDLYIPSFFNGFGAIFGWLRSRFCIVSCTIMSKKIDDAKHPWTIQIKSLGEHVYVNWIIRILTRSGYFISVFNFELFSLELIWMFNFGYRINFFPGLDDKRTLFRKIRSKLIRPNLLIQQRFMIEHLCKKICFSLLIASYVTFHSL